MCWQWKQAEGNKRQEGSEGLIAPSPVSTRLWLQWRFGGKDGRLYKEFGDLPLCKCAWGFFKYACWNVTLVRAFSFFNTLYLLSTVALKANSNTYFKSTKYISLNTNTFHKTKTFHRSQNTFHKTRKGRITVLVCDWLNTSLSSISHLSFPVYTGYCNSRASTCLPGWKRSLSW